MAEFTGIEEQLIERIAESRPRESLALIRNAVEDIWADDAPRIIQDYTDHGIHHSERLADYAAQLLAVNGGRPLSAEETYLLLAGIYLHDIGMQCDVVKYPEIKAKAEAMGAKFDVGFTAETASSYTIDEQKAIRKNHHLLTGAWIDHARRTGDTVLGPAIRTVPGELVGDLIDVCKYHAKLPITECPITFTLDERGRRQLVAALVRFADELDVDSHRVSIETVKNFRLDPRNAIYWWLHQLTKVIIAGNVITLTTRLRPDDEHCHGPLVREAFIEEFRTKNHPVLGVLRQNNIPVAISADSGVVPYEYADPLPDDIVQALQLMCEKKGVLDELADEVKTWLEAIGYEVSEPKGEGPIRDMVAILQRGLVRQQVLVRCFEGEIAQADLEALEAEPSPQKWGISEMRVAPSAREYAKDRLSVQVFNLADFMRLIWGPYFDYLTALVEESDIPHYYVDLGCHKKEIDEEGSEVARDTYAVIDNYIDDWLSERGRLHISLLGEFGTGKTWFCCHYAYRQLKRYLDDPIKERLPLLITLRAFTKAMTAQQLINDALLEQYKLPFVGSAFDIFQEMNRRGKLLLILDGFDEMARKVEYQTVVDNFWELAQVVVEGSKVLLTSRSEYFRWAKESEKVLGGEELGRRMIVIEPPKFEVLYLEPFSDEQIKEVIVKRVGEEKGLAVARRILDTQNLAALARKPVLIELLLAALPEIEAREEVNEAQIYLYATNELLLRNITAERTFTTTADKLFFLCELAWEMIRGGELRIHYTDIPERIEAWFGNRIKNKPELDHWDYDLRNQTLLQRNAAGYYEFAHKSLAEYFVAYKFAAELGCLVREFTQTYCEADGMPCKLPIAPKDVVGLARIFGVLSLSDERMGATRNLLSGMVGDTSRLWALLDDVRLMKSSDAGYLASNLVCLLADLKESFVGRDLSHMSLVGFSDFSPLGFQGLDLEGANFSYSKMETVVLARANLKGVNFEETEMIFEFGTPVLVDVSGSNDFSFLGDTELLVAIGWKCINLWNVASSEEARTIDLPSGVDWLSCLETTPDGRYICAASGRKLLIWDVTDGFRCTALTGHTNHIRGIVVSSDGKRLASYTDGWGPGNRGEIEIWSLEQKHKHSSLVQANKGIFNVCFATRQNILVAGGRDGVVWFFDLDTGQVARSISTEALGNPKFVYSLSLSPDNRLLAIGTTNPWLTIWDVVRGEVTRTISLEQSYYTLVAFDATGEYLLAVNERQNQTELISTDGWERVYSGPPGLRRAKFSPHGRYLAIGPTIEDARIMVVDVESRKEVWKVLYRVDFSGMNIKGLKAPSSYLRFFRERGAVGSYTQASLERMTKAELHRLSDHLKLEISSGRTKVEIVKQILDSLVVETI